MHFEVFLDWSKQTQILSKESYCMAPDQMTVNLTRTN